MTPKILFKQHVTVASYQNSSAVPASTRWVIAHLFCTPTSGTACTASIQTSDSYNVVYNSNLAVGETLDFGPLVLEATEYLKFQDTTATYDVVAVGYEEAV